MRNAGKKLRHVKHMNEGRLTHAGPMEEGI